MKGIDIAGAGASISALEFCSFTLCLAISNEIGMVRVECYSVLLVLGFSKFGYVVIVVFSL